MYAEEDLLPISALQHLVFCPRQCALIHMDRAWEENSLTAEGKQLHSRVHQDDIERRGGVRIVRSLRLRSLRYGITGVADVVEFAKASVPNIVEYKRGKSKPDKSDEVQLCAQALCLEEMLQTEILSGSMFYWQPRRRERVNFSEELRDLTLSMISTLRDMLDSGNLPKAIYSKKCRKCSLIEQCMPEISSGRRSANRYYAVFFKGTEDMEQE